ncbi:MAG TPA: MFS transporter [Halanaerobiaceae bacterium]|jgi:MFS family permease|nr:MFS transporter [Halanaerobiaceae bacterium]HOA39944.1 MFS transporter [Halanaerobiales bacterium]HPZ62019.1 MFS transporter [Halanaerobiales bacterium]HQD03257.1 MFS transporter [Halanaerobiales bacterium]
MEGSRAQESLWNKYYITLLLIGLITSLSFSMLYTIISAYAVEIGSSLSLAGVVAGVFSISALVLRPISGLIADRRNKKWVFALALLVITTTSLGYAFSRSIPILIFFRILHGAAFGISSTVNISLLSEFIPRNRLAEGLGYFSASQVISRIIGPTLGVNIADLFNYNVLFLIIAIFNFLALLILWGLSYEYTGVASKKTTIKIDSLIAREVIVYAAVGGVFSLSNGITNSFLVLMGNERAIPGISIFFAINALTLSIVRLFIGRQADKKSITLIVNISLLCSAISMLSLGFAYSLSLVIIAAFFKALGLAGGQVSLQAECIRRVDEDRSGVAASTYYIGADIGNGIGPMVGGAISSMFNYKIMFISVSIFMGLTAVLFNLYQRKHIS